MTNPNRDADEALFAGLGVDPDQRSHDLCHVEDRLEAARLQSRWSLTDLPDTRVEFIREHLAYEMRLHRGNKRIRKKRAKRSLRAKWHVLQMASLIARRVDYSAFGRAAFSVEPLPE